MKQANLLSSLPAVSLLTKARQSAPIRLGVAFSILTFTIFLFGPWKFRFQNDFWLTTMFVIYTVSMYVGFAMGARINVTYKPRVDAQATKRIFLRIGTVAFAVTAITVIPRFMIETGFLGGNITDLFTQIRAGWSDAQSVYSQRQSRATVTGLWKVINLVCVATSFVSWLYTAVAILTWDHLNQVRKIFTVAYWLVLVLQSIAKGQNFGIFDLAVQISVFLVIRQLLKSPGRARKAASIPRDVARRTRRGASLPRTGRARALGYGAATAVAVTIFLLAFSNTMSSRVGDRYDASLAGGADGAEVDYKSTAWQLLPREVRSPALALTYYVAHGYVGLALAQDVPFTSTYGAGSSVFVINNVEEVFGIDVRSSTYQYKIEGAYGYEASSRWHTAYSWIANDVSPYGVPFVLLGLMAVFGFAWKDFLVNGNLFGVLLMGVFATFFGFISANNHAFSEANSLLAFWMVLILWLLTRRDFDWSGMSYGSD